jgi:DNA-binding CsgD family transcriptional regulator
MKQWKFLLYGIPLGILLVLLQYFQYRFVILDHAVELYVGLIAVLFTGLGIWAGQKLLQPKPTAPARSDTIPSFQPDTSLLERLTITPREFEVLFLIAQGLSNQEIADRLYLSLNTIKTHTSNLFGKLEVQRRTQAVQKAKEIGLLP